MKLLAIALILALCACRPPSACPEPPKFDPPTLLYPALPDDADAAQIIVALRFDWAGLMAELAKRDTALDAYRKPKREKAK